MSYEKRDWDNNGLLNEITKDNGVGGVLVIVTVVARISSGIKTKLVVISQFEPFDLSVTRKYNYIGI